MERGAGLPPRASSTRLPRRCPLGAQSRPAAPSRPGCAGRAALRWLSAARASRSRAGLQQQGPRPCRAQALPTRVCSERAAKPQACSPGLATSLAQSGCSSLAPVSRRGRLENAKQVPCLRQRANEVHGEPYFLSQRAAGVRPVVCSSSAREAQRGSKTKRGRKTALTEAVTFNKGETRAAGIGPFPPRTPVRPLPGAGGSAPPARCMRVLWLYSDSCSCSSQTKGCSLTPGSSPWPVVHRTGEELCSPVGGRQRSDWRAGREGKGTP